MAHSVKVLQLRSINSDNAFFNVDAKYGNVSVWTNTDFGLTFLLRSKRANTVRLIQFDDHEWACEWLIKYSPWFDEIEIL